MVGVSSGVFSKEAGFANDFLRATVFLETVAFCFVSFGFSSAFSAGFSIVAGTDGEGLVGVSSFFGTTSTAFACCGTKAGSLSQETE